MAEEGEQSASFPLELQSEAVIESCAAGGEESTCNNADVSLSGCNAESSAVTSNSGEEASLDVVDEMLERGFKAVKDGDFAEAANCYSRALEIRVALFGELAPECINAYYEYGCALLYKAQEKADPLGFVPKKEAESQQASAKISANSESSTTSVASTAAAGGQHESLENQEEAVDDASGGNNQEDDDDSEDEDITDEDESDLDLAWKMLDIARVIVEKNFGDTRKKVDILSALAEVSLEREDIETSLSDYKRALSMLEKLAEPDDRQIAILNFRICLCLEIGFKPDEAIPYCQKAISVCKSRVQRLMDETKSSPASSSSSSVASNTPSADRETEIETVSGLASQLEKKLEDLQQVEAIPSSVLTELLGLVASKAKEMEKAAAAAVSSSHMARASSDIGPFDSQTVSSAHTNGPAKVTHLGVVGRGVKRITMSSTPSSDSSAAAKKPAVDSSLSQQDHVSSS